MRIISKFRDYYDGVRGLGHDDRLTYVRHEEVFDDLKSLPVELAPVVLALEPLVPDPFGYTVRSARNEEVFVQFGLILFAGRLHPVASVRQEPVGGWSRPEPSYMYDFHELKAFVDKTGFADQSGWSWHLEATRRRMKSAETFFRLGGSEQLMVQALGANVPCLAYWYRGLRADPRCRVRVNPNLSRVQFYRRLDAWQAWQELSMFLGNIAAPDRVPSSVADSDRIAQRGFDKWSFRKRPGEVSNVVALKKRA